MRHDVSGGDIRRSGAQSAYGWRKLAGTHAIGPQRAQPRRPGAGWLAWRTRTVGRLAARGGRWRSIQPRRPGRQGGGGRSRHPRGPTGPPEKPPFQEIVPTLQIRMVTYVTGAAQCRTEHLHIAYPTRVISSTYTILRFMVTRISHIFSRHLHVLRFFRTLITKWHPHARTRARMKLRCHFRVNGTEVLSTCRCQQKM